MKCIPSVCILIMCSIDNVEHRIYTKALLLCTVYSVEC
jgi:hypothetical protein